MKGYMTWEDAVGRYPLLVRAMRWAAILSVCEAGAAIRDHRTNPRDKWGGGEAVQHFGGPVSVIRAAIRARGHVRRLYRMA